MQDFIYNAPTKVYFGKGKEREIGKIVKEYGYSKIMVQYGQGSVVRSGLLDTVLKELKDNGIEVVLLGGVEPNPKITFVREAIKIAKSEKVELVPVGCILTMSAAGSEMSNSAVITNLELNMKKGCSTELNRCKFAICNPELTFTVSEYQSACGIVDIMSHTMERYFTLFPETDLTDRIAESVLVSVISAGKKVLENPRDYDARATVMWASSLSHNGLTACGRENYLAVHQLEHAVSGEFDTVAHGAGLAVLFPAWARYVYKHNIPRFAQFARRVWGVVENDDECAAVKGIDAMAEYFISLKMPSKLSEFGIDKSALPRLAELCTYGKTRTVKSYIPLGYDEILAIFESCY